ncbi:MAG: hypothetical protein JNK87_30720 [Bryobacterales bacterium]|nr:hypothetical protein [Bryobacterales bacterium]
MPRADLLALTEDDLATLASRGLLKRALRDIESGAGPTACAEAPDGTVTAQWADGATVTLAPSMSFDDRCCTCAATGLCRHILGTILHYQATAPRSQEQAQPEPWNPGLIADDTITGLYKPAVYEAVRKEWQAGQVVEAHVLLKPLARLHTAGHTVRFLVPNDLRYTQCDCAEEAPCRHVPLAIWGFRALRADRTSALLAVNQRPPAPQPHTAEIRELLTASAEFGIAGLPPTLLRRWQSLETALRKDRIHWLADITSEILLARDRHLAADARFSPPELADLAAELLLRANAMEANTGAVPQLFVRGTAKETAVEIGSARLIGLGSFVDVRRKSVTLHIPLQDTSTGLVVSILRDSEANQPFAQLAAAHFNKTYRYQAIASGQILAKGAKRTPNLVLMASRAPLVVHPQSFEWEKLRPPVLAEGFAEIRAHLSVLPPASLRPRRANENLYVCPIAQVVDVAFDPAAQRLQATLVDPSGERATLDQPYYSRAAGGFSRLRKHLGQTPLRFVAARVRLSHHGLCVEPCGLVFEENGARWLLQPWIDEGPVEAVIPQSAPATATDPIARYLGEILAALGDMLTLGIERTDALTLRTWQDLVQHGEGLGFVRLLEPVRQLHAELDRRSRSLDHTPERTVALVAELLSTARFGLDLSS